MIWLVIFGVVALLFFVAVFFGAPYVPSHKARLGDAFEQLYPLSVSDVVVDVGSGDGVVLRYVSQQGVRAIGYEINPLLVLVSRVLSLGDQRVRVLLANFWTTSFPLETTVVYAFTVSRDIDRMLQKLEHEATRLGRPLVLLSYGIASKQRPAAASRGAHHRYDIAPLQLGEA